VEEDETGKAEEPTVEAVAEEAPKKKRTRRGTRGGRGRKKTTATASATEEAPVAEGDGAGDGRLTPTIHLPPPDLGASGPESDVEIEAPMEEGVAEADTATGDAQAKKKRTRRGTRGGRRRRKPAANGARAEGDAQPASAAEPDEPASGYVPMSEWIDDLDPRAQTPG
jgi:ribonuclease E